MGNSANLDDRVATIVAAALRQPPNERESYVRLACEGDGELQREVAEALAWEERMGDFLQEPATLTEERPFPSAITAGAIGPYRLLQKIGEGGMAEVWQAEQTSPVHRTVALKFIKAGMDTKALVARFESERQALALMEHPAIARVFDAGSTAEGRPYFVMEYTPGVPITDYCDKYRLSMRERLALFVQVCEGVQHAHQKAIIHRDLKPSNVLVCMQDGKAVPKIIDFGIAKALSQMLTERTMFTELGVLVGTPEYMSPEQADLTVHNIDTRTDVYSLGLILYELLAGALPFDAKEFRREGWGEILRRIREEEPTRPSTKVRTLGDGAAVAARNRKTEPQALERQLRGDLDWITMKALEKDRTRRYGSPSELAAEISRYLRHEPVVASPPSVVYRARKFARRHRFGVGVAAGLIVLLLGFALTMGLQAQRIARERDRANREAEVSRRVKEFLIGLFQISDPSEARGSTITAREILDKGAAQIDTALQNQPEIQAQLMQTMGLVYQKLGLYGQAASLLERAVSTQSRVLGPEHPDTLSSMGALGGVYRRRGRGSDAEKILRRALEISQRRLGPDRLETLQAMNNLARVLAGEGPGGPHKEEAATLLKGALERARRALGADHQVTLQSAMYLAMAYSNEGRFDEAEPLFREAVAGRRRTLGPAHSDTLDAVHNLALNLIYKKHYREAEELLSEALPVQRRVLGPEHPDTLRSMNSLGWNYMEQHRYREAESLFREALPISRRVLGDKHGNTCGIVMNLAGLAALQGKRDAAFATLQEAIAVYDLGHWPQVDGVGSDDDFKSLHGDPRWDALLAQLRRITAAK